MATGRSPFAADSTPAVLRRVLEEVPPPVPTINPAMPPWLAHIIDRLLEKRAEDRIPSAEALARILQACLAGLRSGEEPEAVVARLPRRARTKAKARAASWRAIAALGSTGAIAWVLWTGAPFGTVSREPAAIGTEVVPEAPFQLIRGGRFTRAFLDLNDAVREALSGDVLEIGNSAPVHCDPLMLGTRKLTIRAAQGRRPVLINRSSRQPFLSTEGVLMLEGIELRSFTGDSDFVMRDAPGEMLQFQPATRAQRLPPGSMR
jgi:hypothetical protein